MKKFEWDVTKNDRITYFDPTLTYELTGYRPITMTEGLDFDPTPFIEAGQNKMKTGRYTNMPLGTKAHRDWWTEEHRRCREGYEVNGYRITGDHYFFLNFYVLMNVKDVQKAGEGRDETCPDFWSKHYEYFHYIEMCELLKKDVIAFKSRGVGFSEIAVALGVRPYTTTPNYSAVYVAFSEGLLEPTLAKVWRQLEYLNMETETGMKRLRQNINTNMHKQASVKDSDGNVKGHMAELKGIIVDNARKLRGRRIDRLIYEESGSNPILNETYVKGEALVRILGKKLGTRIVFGTGGDEGPPLAALEKMFLDPDAFNGLPYKHNYTRTGDYTFTGFFLPAYSCLVSYEDPITAKDIPCMDHRGVTDEAKAKEYYERERQRLAHLPKDLMDYCAEYCFIPEEALNKQGVNDFNQVLLAEQYTQIEIHKAVPKPERGRFFWIYDGKDSNKVIGVRWHADPKGPVEISEHPVEGKPNLYVAGVDSIDHGEEDSVVGDKGSQFCIVVKKRTFGIDAGNRYVCKYIERPKDVRTAYTIAAQILWYYGCKANLEDTKISFRTWLREKKLDRKMLMHRPQYALTPGKKRTDSMWGTPGSEKNIRHGLDLVRDFIEDYCHTLNFLDAIIQLQRFSYEMKGKYDIVMAMVYAEIGDEDMYDMRPDYEARKPDSWEDIGYYYDDKGIKRFGVLPAQNKIQLKISERFDHEYTL